MRLTRVVMRTHGGPELLELEDAPAPAPGPGMVRLAVETAGVSPADLLICWGVHPEARRAPFTPGWDVIGTVEALGPGVESPAVGQRVAALTIVDGFSTRVLVNAAHVVPVPAGVDLLAAQCLPFDGAVALQLLVRTARAAPGDRVFLQGAAGSIGGLVVELCRCLGLTCAGTVSRAKAPWVASMGGVPLERDGDTVSALHALWPGGADLGLDGLGHTLVQTARCVRRGGLVVGYGHASSVMGGRRDWRKLASILGCYAAVFGAAPLTGRRAALYSLQQLLRRFPQWYREDVARLFSLLERGQLHPRVHGVFPLEEARAALELVSSGAVVGKLVLRMR